MRIITEHGTVLDVFNPDGCLYAEVVLYDPEQTHSEVSISLTPREARTLGDALLTASQTAEDRAPHGNC